MTYQRKTKSSTRKSRDWTKSGRLKQRRKPSEKSRSKRCRQRGRLSVSS